ncbi:TPA: helix-turn-helix domain-containing protein [Pseudomonas aeruginosa]
MTGTNQKALAEGVGRAIAKQRIRCGMTQDEVAEVLGVGNEAVSRIERGIVMPNVARLFEFATIFNCNAMELLSEASLRPDDQATRISGLLNALEETDRQLILDMVERLSARLSRG